MAAQVRVSKSLSGKPIAEMQVDAKVGGAQLAGLIQKVVTNEKVLKAAGLKACPACKSGLDIHILDHMPDIIRIDG